MVRDYRALLQLIPSYAGSRELAAEVFYQLNEREELDSLLKEAQEAGVLTAELKRYRFLLMADEAKTREALLQALDYARTVHEQGEKEGWSDGQKARLYALRARNYWRIQGVDTALQLIEKAILLDPEDSEYVYIKAGLCKDKRDYEGALKLYLQCESDYDQTPHFYANVGECYDSMGQKDEALSWLERAAQMEPDNAGVRARILRIFRAQPKQLALEEVRQKAELYARQMTESGNSAWHWIESGLLYMELQEYGQAANQLERAVAADPEDPFAHSNLARAYRLLNRRQMPCGKEKKGGVFRTGSCALALGSAGGYLSAAARVRSGFGCLSGKLEAISQTAIEFPLSFDRAVLSPGKLAAGDAENRRNLSGTEQGIRRCNREDLFSGGILETGRPLCSLLLSGGGIRSGFPPQPDGEAVLVSGKAEKRGGLYAIRPPHSAGG